MQVGLVHGVTLGADYSAGSVKHFVISCTETRTMPSLKEHLMRTWDSAGRLSQSVCSPVPSTVLITAYIAILTMTGACVIGMRAFKRRR